MKILLIETISGLYVLRSDIIKIVDHVAYLNNGAKVKLKVVQGQHAN